MSLVLLENATVTHAGARLLGPLTLEIGPGEFWGIVGPNGAGKSTLLHVLAGLQTLAGGRAVYFDAARQSGINVTKSLLMRRIGILFQHHDFLPEIPFTVGDVVGFGRVGWPHDGAHMAENRARIGAALAALGLTDMRRRLYRELSGGERRKTQLARLLAQGAELLLLDEPAAGLDLDWQARLTQLVEELYQRHGQTFVMVTHDVDLLPASCTRVLLLKDGQALAAGAPADVLRADLLSRLYGCPMEVAVRNGRWHAFRA